MNVHSHGDSPVRRLRWVMILTGGFLVVEFIGGLLANSLALLSDAGHMLSDVTALLLALIAMQQRTRPPDAHHSFGWRRIEIVSALANGALLCGMAFVVAVEGFRRLSSPPEVRGGLMLGVAGVGLAVNLLGILLLRHGSKSSLGIRGAFLHMIGDTIGSIGAITAAIVIQATGWTQADSVASFAIALLILASGLHLIRESLHILIEGVPRDITLPDVAKALCGLPGVMGIHDLHVWRIGSDFDTLTVHLVLADPADWKERRDAARTMLRDRFGIQHCTIEVDGPEDDERSHGPGTICEHRNG